MTAANKRPFRSSLQRMRQNPECAEADQGRPGVAGTAYSTPSQSPRQGPKSRFLSGLLKRILARFVIT